MDAFKNQPLHLRETIEHYTRVILPLTFLFLFTCEVIECKSLVSMDGKWKYRDIHGTYTTLRALSKRQCGRAGYPQVGLKRFDIYKSDL